MCATVSTFSAREPAAPPPHAGQLLLGSYNLHKAVGSDLRRDPARTIEVIGELGADIVALQEVDRRFGDRRGVLDLDRLAAGTGLRPVPLTDRLGRRAHGWHGNLLLLRNAEVEDVTALTLPGLEPRGAIMADLRVGGAPLRVIAAHLGLLRQSRLLQAQFLAAQIAARPARPTIVMGDFNEWRMGPGCSLLPLRRGLDSGVAELAPVASFPSRLPLLALDRILGCTLARLSDLQRHDSPLARLASDHLPIRARLSLPEQTAATGPGRAARQFG